MRKVDKGSGIFFSKVIAWLRRKRAEVRQRKRQFFLVK
jgi:hypothetical protein